MLRPTIQSIWGGDRRRETGGGPQPQSRLQRLLGWWPWEWQAWEIEPTGFPDWVERVFSTGRAILGNLGHDIGESAFPRKAPAGQFPSASVSKVWHPWEAILGREYVP